MAVNRLKSIDIFRALTMLLMIFVNDLWSLSDIPDWLGHKPAEVDGMGLADVVFPAFLFIVGLSVPLAIRARQKRGDSRWKILRHIMERSLSLMVMGVFMVNLEYIDQQNLLISKPIWQILMTAAFFLIWNVYRARINDGLVTKLLKGAGWTILLFLAIIYKAEDQGNGTWMHFHWWGILGLIGWAYLLSALAYLFIGNRTAWLALVLVVFYLLNINEFVSPFSVSLKIVVSASNYALVMGGVFATAVMIRLREQNKLNYLVLFLAGYALLFVIFGFVSRPLWGISKIMATPSWSAICAAISAVTFALLFQFTDTWGKNKWAKIIEPAGSSTLTCYLIPYFVYGLWSLSGISAPELINTGALGLLKSALFSFLIIQLTGLIGSFGIKLKI